jgi:F-type H+/Na+-transporting ATPase subunit alpha
MNVLQPTGHPQSLLAAHEAKLQDYRFSLRASERGTVVSIGDGIVWFDGLPSAAIDEIVAFQDGSQAMVFHLTRHLIGGILLKKTRNLTAGLEAELIGQELNMPTGSEWLGRVVDPLGVPLDGLPPPTGVGRRRIFGPSPGIIDRDFVHKPLYTGNKVIDTLIPIGKGQRQLLIGDNGVGKSTLALDTVIHQQKRGVYCIYVIIGQKRSTTVQIIDLLRQRNAMEYTTVVVADATALPGLKYLAPFAGCTMAESWMHDGLDTLIVYDDLSTHAQTYRELSLLLRRPPGREAYPADIFFLHSQLLERSTCLAAERGGGSMTALPIVETAQGEIASYIPTNLISITDGQIFLDTRLFSAGVLPAIDVTRSVSRIGGKGQHKRIKEQAGRMKLDYLQFLELEVFTRFGAKLEASVEKKIKRGRILREILKQNRLSPLPIECHMAWLIAYNQGFFDDVPLDKVHDLLDRLIHTTRSASLKLDDSIETWEKMIQEWYRYINEEMA